MMRWVAGMMLAAAVVTADAAQWVISGNENKIDLTSGTPTPVADAADDSLTLLDFDTFPPKAITIEGVPNSVIGPPSNIAITPDHAIALIASSIQLTDAKPEGFGPDNVIRVLDLTLDPPEVIQTLQVEAQPSGMSISKDGQFALVANRAAGSVTMLTIDGKKVTVGESLVIGTPEDDVSDVAISPDGKTALASVQKGGYLALIGIEDGRLVDKEKHFSVSGDPYRCVITPNGELAITGGSGLGYPDLDALTVVDLTLDPPRTVDYVTMGSGPESVEVSPDGQLAVAVLMNGSNIGADAPGYQDHGLLVLFARRGKTFEKVQEVATGTIPEGVAFSPDGQYVIVQCHPDRELRFYEVTGEKLRDTGERMAVPGMPSGLRAAP